MRPCLSGVSMYDQQQARFSVEDVFIIVIIIRDIPIVLGCVTSPMMQGLGRGQEERGTRGPAE